MNPKDLTSSSENNYAYMRKMFVRTNVQPQYTDTSSYIQKKKMVSVGRQTMSYTTFYTQNNKREILQSLRRLRSRSS